jgi:AcrR family transcriptional regulator
MEEARLPRRAREKERQRQEMLKAAFSLFTEKGYHNVTMQEIAEKAEFAIGTLYKFFRNKEDLYQTLILEMSDEFNATILNVLNEPHDEVEKLRNFVQTQGELLRSNIPMIRLYFSEIHGESFNPMAGLDAEIRRRHDKVVKRLADIFASGIRNKRFRPIADPQSLALALHAIITAFFFRWLEKPQGHEHYEKPDTILNILFKGLLDE